MENTVRSKKTSLQWVVLLLLATCAALILHRVGLTQETAVQLPREMYFSPRKIDGPVHDPVHKTFWYGPFSECASVADFNGDGKLDIAAGRNLYLAPDYTKLADFREGAETNGPETDDNSEFALDVNNDGRQDIVSSGWMRMKGVFWYENPGKPGVKWLGKRLHFSTGIEGVIHGNINGRGDKDLLINHFAGSTMTWLEHLDQAPWYKEHALGPQGEGHGNGLGDVNMDGRTDIVTSSGWWENPPNASTDKWTWHPDYRFEGGAASHPILVYDVNRDGLNDILIGNSHGFGLAWLEQKATSGKRSFVQHWAEIDFDGFHTLELGDLDGDGRPELVTGKRLFPHHGRDIGEFNPLFMFYYTISPSGQWGRHLLSYNHIPWYPLQDTKNPAPNYAIGAGMKLNIDDMDGDGKKDVIATGKSGLYILYNKGLPNKTGPMMRRDTFPLEDENAYPSWIEWSTPMPQPDKEGFTPLFNGKDLSTFQPATNWAVEDGVIVLKGRNDFQEHNDNYLWTLRPYGDFILELDFKPEEATNSGVFIRTSDINDPVYTGFEIQVSGGGMPPGFRAPAAAPGRGSAPGPGFPGKGGLASLYDLVAAKDAVLKPKDWNRYRITCNGPKVSVELNGKLVTEADLDQWTQAGMNPDGTKNKFKRAIKDYDRSGYIGLQDHGSPVSYRNIRIKPLGRN
ncbi:MAG: DUF1080 domain-containing protein [Acidobacteria bacterium]|nr:DUF1080 domain-containing protein [Acidobacteriota bacterium]